ncbi:hypothetical protein H4J02_09690 [Protaetiibacter sp. SSC-01]|uniref:hypothetical protein n=1 Tax=Protaetiibacter sp. SSC-01 TaxID=2759943 RepID=UPI0016575A18|nr:hypothetical protein [Protaetiibacter sp. SSC-01]QNO36757.1 hypothetical protein H4J02_09690 [Protaetiibacter sp. SSC-01]
MTPRAARLLRGALLGGVATVLAAVSHLVGGGPAPSGLALVLGGVFATAVGTIAVGRLRPGRRALTLPRVISGVAISQLAFHLVFSLLGQGAAVATTGGHHGLAAIASDPGAAIAQGGAGMWIAHLVAGVLTVLYLRHLESRVWTVLAQLGGLAVRALRVAATAPVADAPRLTAARAPRVPAASALLDTIARRGPPAAARA